MPSSPAETPESPPRPPAPHAAEDRALLDAFERCTLPFEQWDHRAHVRVGYLYVSSVGLGESIEVMRAHLEAYNRTHADRVRVGYHETITAAFLTLIHARLEASGSAPDSQAFCERHPELLSPALLERHYSDDLLWSDRARREWVPPDLQPLTGEVSIDDFALEDAPAFEALNLEWIRAHFEVEAADLETLRDPQGKVLAAGGHIHMARLSGEAVGTVALIPMGADRFELAKMAVAPRARGLGIGERLGRVAIETARRRGAKSVYLESNRQLEPAIGLYRKLGFQEVGGGATSSYARCDIQMEVQLSKGRPTPKVDRP